MASSEKSGPAFVTAFGRRLRVERTRRGLSQAKFADLLGVNRMFYGALERGRRGVNISRLPGMAVGLGMPVSDLLPECAD
jgi:transcriptional regulator with XRE-family HTH domain